MRLTLHIFKKDARRLWWEIAVSLGLLAALAWMDSQRADYLPGAMEGMFNLLLPAAWSYLIALLIHQEALVGDRQFWITRPYSWPGLLAAKLLFLLVFVHIPSFLADTAIVSARGFYPPQFFPQLLWKQVGLAGALTLPAAALAAVTRNLAQFVAGAIVIVGAATLLAGDVSAPWIPVDTVRRAIPATVLVLASLAILFLQYARRFTAASRATGIAAAVLAAALFVYVPDEYTFAMRCALSAAGPDSPLAIHAAPRQEQPPLERLPRIARHGATVAIPIAVSGIPESCRTSFEQLGFVIEQPGGSLWKTTARPRRAQPSMLTTQAYLLLRDPAAGWQMVLLEDAAYDRFRGKKVTMHGKIAARLYEEREAGRIAINADTSSVPELGRCSSAIVSDYAGREMLKVVCESPAELPLLAQVKLVAADGREWTQRLGDSLTHVPYPTQTWLSPVNRRTAFFHITEKALQSEGSRWLVPRQALAKARLALFGARLTTCKILTYDVAGLELSHLLTQPARSEQRRP